MADDLGTLLRDAAADPKHTPDFDRLATRGRRQHRLARVGTALAVALALVAGSIVVWPGLLGSRMPVIGQDPTTPAGVEEVELPDGWQRVEIGRAVFGVPGGWSVEAFIEPAHVCQNNARNETVFVLHAGPQGGDNLCTLIGMPTTTLTAMPLSTIPGTLLPDPGPEWSDITTPAGVVGQQANLGESRAFYRFPALDLWLQFDSPGPLGSLPDDILATLAARNATTSGPEAAGVPTVEELRAPYEALFAGLPAPHGDEELVVSGRIDGLGALVEPGKPLPLDQPNAVQDASSVASFVVVVRDADTGEVVAEVIPDTPRGAFFLGPTAGPVGTRYVLEATLNDGGQTTTWTDVAVVVEPVVDVELALTAPAHAGEPTRYVLVNRGTVNITYGAGYRLEQWTGDGWHEIDNPIVTLIGLTLGPAALTDPAITFELPAAGRYRLSKTVYTDGQLGSTDHDAQPTSHEISLDFTTQDASATETDGPRWTTGTLRAPGQGERFWSIDLDDGHQVAGDDSAYLDVDTLPAVITCFDGTHISESDLRAGERVRVTATGAQTSAPPILVVERLEADCRSLPPR